MEALIAFFFEATFIELWISGRDRLPKKLHCGCIRAVAVGTPLSSCFILAANSFLQHPAGGAAFIIGIAWPRSCSSSSP